MEKTNLLKKLKDIETANFYFTVIGSVISLAVLVGLYVFKREEIERSGQLLLLISGFIAVIVAYNIAHLIKFRLIRGELNKALNDGL